MTIRGCDPVTIAAKMELAMESFQNVRSQVAQQWDDPMHRTVEEQFLVPLDAKYRRAMDVIQHLAETLRKAERECS
jgi:hypothetical protein